MWTFRNIKLRAVLVFAAIVACEWIVILSPRARPMFNLFRQLPNWMTVGALLVISCMAVVWYTNGEPAK